MITYNAATWYWAVGQDQSRVWSSAAAKYVPTSDADYQAWLASGGLTTRIASEAELTEVLLAQYPAGAPNTAASALAVGTVNLVSVATPALNSRYSIGPDARALITSIQLGITAGQGVPGGGATFHFTDADGVSHEFTPEQFTAFAIGVRDYIYTVTRIAGGATSLVFPSSTISIA